MRYTLPVRKLLGLTLLLLFSLPTIAPLLALTSIARPSLPACCRTAGAHRCLLRTHTTAATTNFAPTGHPCPFYPAALPTLGHSSALAPPFRSLIYAELLSHPATRPQTRARARIALDRSRQKRGPPAPALL